MDDPPKAHSSSSGRDARAPRTASCCREERPGLLDPQLPLSSLLQPTASDALRTSVTSMWAGVWVIAMGGRAERTAT